MSVRLARRALLRLPWDALATPRVRVDPATCLAWRDVTCVTCVTRCRDGALTLDRRGRPVADAARCTSCRECVEPCPVGAIEVAAVKD